MSNPLSSIEHERQTLLSASDTLVEDWLLAAKAGRDPERERLLLWAYTTARTYYDGKLAYEQALRPEDVEELTADFYVEFERRLPEIRMATRYARRVLKSRLYQYLVRKRMRRLREPLWSGEELEHVVREPDGLRPERPWEWWTDEEWAQYRVTVQMLNEADEMTRSVVTARLRGVPYRLLAERLQTSEAALRMRVSRFGKAVRTRFDDLHRR